jgi:hypothetical protein
MGASGSRWLDVDAMASYRASEDKDLICVPGAFEGEKCLCDRLADVASANDCKVLETGHGYVGSETRNSPGLTGCTEQMLYT